MFPEVIWNGYDITFCPFHKSFSLSILLLARPWNISFIRSNSLSNSLRFSSILWSFQFFDSRSIL